MELSLKYLLGKTFIIPLLVFKAWMSWAQTPQQQVPVIDVLIRTDSVPKVDRFSTFQAADSIMVDFRHATDSIRRLYEDKASLIESEVAKTKNTIESLSSSDISTRDVLDAHLDSLQRLSYSIKNEYLSSVDSLKTRTIGGLQSLDVFGQYKERLDKLSASISDVDISYFRTNISSIEIPRYSVEQINGFDVSANITMIDNMQKVAQLPDVEAQVGDLNLMNDNTGVYQEGINKVLQGNIPDVEKLPEVIEAQASRIEGINELQEQTGVIKANTGQLGELADPTTSKKKAVSLAKEKAIDHFASKQERLKEAMKKISKYKEKYSSVSSIKDLPKRPPNPMTGKPIVDRLVPGLYLQYQQKNFYLLDVNPYVGYKVSGRLVAGVGWNHRYAYDHDNRFFTSRASIFGPRAYVDFKLGKGFIAHVEGETMNSFVPSAIHGNPDSGQREWVWSLMTGIKKGYRIYKNLNGTALIQYNLFNRYYKAPYVDRLNSRVGFEYELKKRKAVAKK